MTTSTENGIENQNTYLTDESLVKNGTPKYLLYDKRPTIGTREVRGESWDMFIVRKLKEYHEYTESSRRSSK